ncbi:MAG: Gfo/Idh/MocA family oxidoreductase [Cyclobacteriaceae bacterium]|nr:Gfo/Idh/MocA family oxidoreductase [Cyclobacteriaceae bacterium]
MSNLGRRDFLKKAGLGVSSAMFVPGIIRSSAHMQDHIRLAHIGVGAHGSGELKNYFLPFGFTRSVAVSDVWKNRRKDTRKLIRAYYKDNQISSPKCRDYLDFEELLERKDIDAVVINSPDHWHTPMAIKAARAGKHIWLAKPLGLSYPHYKVLEKEIAAHDVRFHYGTQQRAQKHMQAGIDMIREGKIGEIEHVEIWCPGLNPVPNPVCIEEKPPRGFDFDRWTGPAPLNPYCPDRATNNSSWFQWDYSIGFLAGWGAHPLDVLVWALKDQVKGSYSCNGTGTFWDSTAGMYNNIMSWDVQYEFDSGLKMHFFSHDIAEQKDLLKNPLRDDKNGTTFFGSKGTISLSRGKAISDVPELHRKLQDIPNSGAPDMAQMFVDAIKGGKSKETCPLEDAIISDGLSHLANIAIRRGRKVSWNPMTGSIPDDPEAMKLFTREYRAPYGVGG